MGEQRILKLRRYQSNLYWIVNIMIASKIIQTFTHLLLTIVIILFIITGFGIVNYRIVEQLTLGVLSKLISFQIHSNLIIPLIILLTLHIYFTLRKNFKNKFKIIWKWIKIFFDKCHMKFLITFNKCFSTLNWTLIKLFLIHYEFIF